MTGVPVHHAHAVEDAVAQDAGVVDHAVDAAEVVDRRLDDALGALRIGDAVAVGDRRAAGLADLGDHLVGDLGVGALALGRAAQIVDHDLAAFAGGQQRDLLADAAPRAGHDNDLAREAWWLTSHFQISLFVVSTLRSGAFGANMIVT